ncbi:MAG TPA: hypothetical protein VJN02_12880 [Gammaproteobacteria bacterium]|nr:hypothetical protein [Gammaproteobacteria bacterium]
MSNKLKNHVMTNVELYIGLLLIFIASILGIAGLPQFSLGVIIAWLLGALLISGVWIVIPKGVSFPKFSKAFGLALSAIVVGAMLSPVIVWVVNNLPTM